ncbi:MAG: TraC family protein [Xanthomonadaceae bacterium]|nr:TraC family protein [Xanthomonadaceae bacterium]
MNAIDKRPGEHLLHDLMPYVSFEEETGLLWLKDGSATKTFSLVPKNCMSYTDDDFEVMRSGLLSVLGLIPEGTLVQILLNRERTNESSDQAFTNWKKTHSHEAVKEEGSANQRLFEMKLNELKKLWSDGFLHQTKIYMTLRVPPSVKIRTGKQLGAFSFIASNRNHSTQLKTSQAIREETMAVYEALKSGLDALGFETDEAKKGDVMEIIFRFLNPDRKIFLNLTESKNQALSENFCLSELVESRSGLNLGRAKVKIGTLKTLPESSFPCLMSSLTVLGKPFSLVMTLLVLPQTEERERLSRKQRLAQGMASGNTVRNLYAESQLQDVEDTLSAMISSGDKLLATSFHVITFEGADHE